DPDELDVDDLDLEEDEDLLDPEDDDDSNIGASGEQKHISPYMWLLLLIPIGAGLIVYRYRVTIQTMLIRLRFKYRDNEETYQKAYLHLLKLLNIKGVTHPPEQTLREF